MKLSYFFELDLLDLLLTESESLHDSQIGGSCGTVFVQFLSSLFILFTLDVKISLAFSVMVISFVDQCNQKVFPLFYKKIYLG